MPRPARQPRGFTVLEMVFAMSLLVGVFLALAAATGQQHRAASRLADRRVALVRAETALAAMQAGRPPEAGVGVRALGAPTPAGVWVEVQAEHNRDRASLIGLVPAEAAPKGGQP